MQERSVLQANFERLIRGQTSICTALEELQRSVDRLPGFMTRANSRGTTMEDLSQASPMDRGGVSPLPSGLLLNQQSGLDREGRPSLRHTQTAGGTTASGQSANLDMFANTQSPHLTLAQSFVERRNSEKAQVYRPQPIYLEMHQGMVRTNYSHLPELARKHFLSRKRELSRSISFVAEQKAGWTAPVALNSIILHPASKRRSVFDILIVVFLLLDAVIVPYAIAWDVHGLWLSFISWVIALFWSLDVMLNFCTGYIKGSQVEMGWRSIAVRYLRGGFTMDFLVLIVEYINLMATNYIDSLADNSSLRIVKVLRFFKITRLIRVVARLRAGLVNRIETTIAYWIQLYGLVGWEHYIAFAQILLKLFFIIAWLSHLGSCIWYTLQQSVSSSGEPTWYNDLLDTGTWEKDDMYMQGFYWAVSTMFSGSSYVAPNNLVEASYSMTWLVMGALFVTSITSTLAAKVIDTQEKMGEAMIKMRTLNTYMGQRKTPVLLALAIQTNFNEAMTEPVRLTELDLPFMVKVSPGLRAELRKCHYAPAFFQLMIFRILNVLQDSSMQMFCYQAAHFSMTKEGEELFSTRANQTAAMLLNDGKVAYTYTKFGTTSETSIPRDPDSPGVDVGPADFLTKPVIQTVVERTSWLCELSLLLEWETVGSAECLSDCELLTVSADNFLKVVSQSPVMSAVVSSFAAGVCEALDQNVQHEREQATDLSPYVDYDVVVANLHQAVRADLVSLPIIDFLRRQQNVFYNMMRVRTLADLEDEVVAGKCHLVMGELNNDSQKNEVCRVCRLVVLRILNADGLICTQLAEKRGESFIPKFNLPARKVDANASPQETINKLIDDDYKLFAPFIKWDKVDMQQDEEYSASYGLRTKYIKFVQTIILEHAFMEASPPLRTEDSAVEGSLPHSHTLSGFARLGQYSTIGTVIGKKSAQSDGFQESLGVILNGPFSCEGSQHAFALCEGQRVSEHQIKFYKWLLPTDYENLHARRSDVEKALEELLYNGMSHERLERLTSWDVKYMTEPAYRSDRESVGRLSPNNFRSGDKGLAAERLRRAGESSIPNGEHEEDVVWGEAV